MSGRSPEYRTEISARLRWKLREQPRIKLQYVFPTTRTDDTPVLLIIWRSVILDGCRGIELEPGDIARALDDMKRVGAILLKSSDL
jgi:hypothetical protein